MTQNKEVSSALGSESTEATSIRTYGLHTQQLKINMSSRMNNQPDTKQEHQKDN